MCLPQFQNMDIFTKFVVNICSFYIFSPLCNFHAHSIQILRFRQIFNGLLTLYSRIMQKTATHCCQNLSVKITYLLPILKNATKKSKVLLKSKSHAAASVSAKNSDIMKIDGKNKDHLTLKWPMSGTSLGSEGALASLPSRSQRGQNWR